MRALGFIRSERTLARRPASRPSPVALGIRGWKALPHLTLVKGFDRGTIPAKGILPREPESTRVLFSAEISPIGVEII